MMSVLVLAPSLAAGRRPGTPRPREIANVVKMSHFWLPAPFVALAATAGQAAMSVIFARPSGEFCVGGNYFASGVA